MNGFELNPFMTHPNSIQPIYLPPLGSSTSNTEHRIQKITNMIEKSQTPSEDGELLGAMQA